MYDHVVTTDVIHQMQKYKFYHFSSNKFTFFLPKVKSVTEHTFLMFSNSVADLGGAGTARPPLGPSFKIIFNFYALFERKNGQIICLTLVPLILYEILNPPLKLLFSTHVFVDLLH